VYVIGRVCAGLVLAVAGGHAGTAFSQTYPAKPVRIIAGGAPGGSIDFIARLVGEKAAGMLGQPMVVENRGGAGGSLAAEAVAKAAPDGYSVLLIGASLAINPSLYPKLAYDPARDYAAVTQATAAGFLLAVHPAVPASTVKELIATAKSRKDGITYASPGSGQAQHLGMELMKTISGFAAVHVPYKGGSPAVLAVAGGEADVTMASVPSALPLLQTHKLKPIAVTSLKRIALLPRVPTVAEAAIPGFEVSGWIGYLVPAATPPQIVVRLHEALTKSLALPDVREALAATGQETIASTPDAFSAYVKAEFAKWAKVVKASGAKAD